MSKDISQEQHRLLHILQLNNLLKGICLGVIVPALWYNIITLQATSSWFQLGVAALESLQIVGRLLVFMHRSWCFSKSVYIMFLFVALGASCLYCVGFYLGNYYGLCAFSASLALHGIWIGCVSKIEIICLNSVYFKGKRDQATKRIKLYKGIGLILGPLLGFAGSYYSLTVSGYKIDVGIIPGYIQIVCVFIMLIAMIFFYPPLHFEKIDSKDKHSDYTETFRHETITSYDSSERIRNQVGNWHLAIFTVMLLGFIFYLSKSLKKVALPILLLDTPSEFKCISELSLEVDGVYIAFAIEGFLDTIGSFFSYNLSPVLDNRYLVLFAVMFIGTGQGLMIWRSIIPTWAFIVSMTLQSFALPFGLNCTESLFYSKIGYKPGSEYTVSYMTLELLGSLIGPFWTVQAYEIKCELCFTFILIWLCFAFILLIFSFRALFYDNKKDSVRASNIGGFNQSMSSLHQSQAIEMKNSKLKGNKIL